MPSFHANRFGAAAHELRGRTGWAAHEAHAPAHERLHRASPAAVHGDAAPAWPAQRQPKAEPRHAGTVVRQRLPAYQGGAAAVAGGQHTLPSHQASGGQQRPAHRAARRIRQQAHHSRPYIHARHLARVAYEQALKQYNVELRQWRQLLVERERLIGKLASLERRVARRAAHPAPHQAGETFEIEGTWFHQIGKHRAIQLRKTPI